jgi:hypothetical protein
MKSPGWHAVGGILEPEKKKGRLTPSILPGFYSWADRVGPSIKFCHDLNVDTISYIHCLNCPHCSSPELLSKQHVCSNGVNNMSAQTE